MFLTAGCATTLLDPVEDIGPAFCLVEEPRRFTQGQVDWRTQNDVANFRRDLKTNTAWEQEECDRIRAEQSKATES